MVQCQYVTPEGSADLSSPSPLMISRWLLQLHRQALIPGRRKNSKGVKSPCKLSQLPFQETRIPNPNIYLHLISKLCCILDIPYLSSMPTTFFFLFVVSDHFSMIGILCPLVMLKAWIMCDFICCFCWSYNLGEDSYSGSRHHPLAFEITKSSFL